MARASRPISRRQTWWLLASAIAAAAPLAQQVPLWLALAGASAFGWRALLTWQHWRLPPRWLQVLLVIAGTVGVFLQYRTILGRTPGIALLLVFLALKLLELRAARDAVVTALLCYFLVLGQFLFTQTIPTAMLAGLTVLITTAALLAASDDRPHPRQQLRRAALLLAQALPFMLLLFVLFPRVQGRCGAFRRTGFPQFPDCPTRCRRGRSRNFRSRMRSPFGFSSRARCRRNLSFTGAAR